jgi:tRNA U34 5-carboxymethylaminomethyl modifying enzyme MnmG/GidA
MREALSNVPTIEWIIGRRAGRIVVPRKDRVVGLALEDGDFVECARRLLSQRARVLNGSHSRRPGTATGGSGRRAALQGSGRVAQVVRIRVGSSEDGKRRHASIVPASTSTLVSATGSSRSKPGDEQPVPFSFLTSRINRPQIPCYLLHTTDDVHRLVRENVAQSPLFNGQIRGIGPRYCPSLEDKVIRFPDRERAPDLSRTRGWWTRRKSTSTASL